LTWVDPAASPDFPPLLSARRIVPGTHVFDAAVAGAAEGSLRAGDALWDGDPTRVAVAIVLEPEVTLRRAVQMLPLAIVAAGDCIGALAPPQVGVMFRWPQTIAVNGAAVGHVRVASPSADADREPDWLVVAIDLRMRPAPDADEPGRAPDRTTLADEGCEDLTNLDLMGSFARHFLTWLNIWQDDGYGPVRYNWLERAEVDGGNDEIGGVTTISGMDEAGNLLVRNAAGEALTLELLDSIEIAPKEF
jgi:BirA family biotin operon repressor/biotin-[acetyl-CoA-carboxylase] ligase